MRWWDGDSWTHEVVAFNGVVMSDPGPVSVPAVAGRTRKAVGDGVRGVLKGASRVPGITLTSDVLRELDSIPLLTDIVKRHPADPLARVWLGEAFERMEGKRSVVRAVMFSPTGFVVRKGVEAASRVGSNAGKAAMSRRCYSDAHSVATARLTKTPRHAKSWDALSRLYLKKGYAVRAVETGRLATLAAPDDPLGFITLSKAYLLAGRRDDAWFAAHAALHRGSTLAYELLFSMGAVPGPIDPRDRVRYSGPRRDVSLIRSVAGAQKQKTQQLGERARPLIDRARPHVNDVGRSIRTAATRPAATGWGPPPEPASSPSLPPAGWYDDPHQGHALRQWDGSAWRSGCPTRRRWSRPIGCPVNHLKEQHERLRPRRPGPRRVRSASRSRR